MLKPSFLDHPSSTSSISPESCANYNGNNSLNISNDHHHQAMINFHDIDQKPYINKEIDDHSPSFSKPTNDVHPLFHSHDTQDVGSVSDGFLNGPPTTENNVNSSSGLVTPPILSSNGDIPRTLPENVGALIVSRLKSDGQLDEGNQPEFPPQFGMTASSPKVDEPLLHKSLSITPMQPEKHPDHDTPSTMSPLAGASSKRGTDSADSPVCDDAEYAAAACAAVDSVVCALVGNKPPSTTAAYDPSLAGTGTDRIYSLSLAPVGKPDPLVGAPSAPAAVVPVCTHPLLLTSVTQASLDGMVSLTCPSCGVTVPAKQLLSRNRPNGEAKHICEACGKGFVREDKLKRHIMSIHTQDKPHVCQLCSKAFSRK